MSLLPESSTLLFVHGPFQLSLKSRPKPLGLLYVLERTDRQPDGSPWPHLTIFPESNQHGGLDVHLTWEDPRRRRRNRRPLKRDFLLKMPHQDIFEPVVKAFGDFMRKMVADMRRVSLRELARDGYAALVAHDGEGLLRDMEAFVPAIDGNPYKRGLDVARFEQLPDLLGHMSFVRLQSLPAMLTDGRVPVGPIVAMRGPFEEGDTLSLLPYKTPKGWTWMARPYHTVAGQPMAELMMKAVIWALPEGMPAVVHSIIDNMGLRAFDIQTDEFDRLWQTRPINVHAA